MIDGGWRGGGPFDFMYALGDVVCHQEAARSFVLNGSQLPLCMRCTGILAGLAFGFVVCTALGSQAGDRRIAVVGAVLVVVMAAEWAVETTGFDSPVLRALSGVSAGAGASLFLGWLAYMEHDWVSR